MDYENMLKAELIAECEQRGLATYGLVADLKARLEENDVELNSIDVVDKTKKVWNPMLFRYEYK
jgi:hypothetical protein|tara:strand:- start:97 stop:288 length:192 start_codon:yes stop_codon:yes gene_type:complete